MAVGSIVHKGSKAHLGVARVQYSICASTQRHFLTWLTVSWPLKKLYKGPAHGGSNSINFLHPGPTSATGTGAPCSWRHTTGSLAIDLHHDRVGHLFQLLLFGLELLLFAELIPVQPCQGLLNRRFKPGLVPLLKLALKLLLVNRIPQREAIIFETILGIDFGPVRLIFGLESLGLVDHAPDLDLRQPALLVCDRDAARFARSLFHGGDV
mmetsp:Transcript_70479/g.183561  ORF Transcript_70479/g.183561 Transcript_70479/m.183561 type:complete len:210 (-) Transcript_70479:1036-1665(-)